LYNNRNIPLDTQLIIDSNLDENICDDKKNKPKKIIKCNP